MVSNDAALQAPFGSYALFFSNQTTRPPIISNKWYGQGLLWFCHCCHLPLGKVKTLALALPCNYSVSGLFVARLRLYKHLDRASNGSSLGLAKLTRVKLCVTSKSSGNLNQSPFGVCYPNPGDVSRGAIALHCSFWFVLFSRRVPFPFSQ